MFYYWIGKDRAPVSQINKSLFAMGMRALGETSTSDFAAVSPGQAASEED